MRIINYGPDNVVNLPVSSAGTAIVAGALMARAVTGTQPRGHLRILTGTSAVLDAYGIIRQALVATTLDTDAAGTIFTTRPIQLIVPGRLVRIPYSTASADLITCTQAVSTTTMTVTSLEDDIDAGFVYVVSGTGLGQINYLTAAAAGSCTLKAAFTTNLDTTSKFIKILPRFNKIASITADGTSLSSQAAAGAVEVAIVDTRIEQNGDDIQLNPVIHSALTGLNSKRSLVFSADIVIRDSFAYTVA